MSTVAAATTEPVAVNSQDKIKVMVVDDSAVVRGLVSRWIDERDDMDVCGRSANGQIALNSVVTSGPDVILLDIEMPVMDGLTALPELLKLRPEAKVIMVSTLTRRNAEISLKALSLGATEYIAKPESNSGVSTSMDFRRELFNKIIAVTGKNPTIARPAPAAPDQPAAPVPDASPAPVAASDEPPQMRSFSSVTPRILAIGSSTGGPQALAKVMTTIGPAIDNVPVVITQHMPPTFTGILAEHLGTASGRPSKEGEDGEAVLPGHIYVAPGGLHMVLQGDAANPVLKLIDGPPVNFCKPAVDPMFDSIKDIYGRSVLALVLTGMGNDGALSAVRVADAGGSVIAQDEASSVVWGMPGSTYKAGACAQVLPLDQIGTKVVNLLRGVNS